jgi:glycosyltransferase involved in cell wall biosynthesis
VSSPPLPGERPRVLMLLENNPYPADFRVRQEAIALVTAGYDVTVLCPRRAGQPREEVVEGVRVRRFPGTFSELEGGGLVSYAAEWGAATVLMLGESLLLARRGRFALVHLHNPPETLSIIGAVHKLLGSRVIFDQHDLSPEMYRARPGQPNPLLYRALVALERFSYRISDHVIATNESYKRIQMTRGGVPESRITVVRNGPDLNLLQPMEPDPELRPEGRSLIAYVGIMGAQDGVDHLLRAVDHIVHQRGRTDVLCVLMGSGDALEELRVLARELRITEHVRFTGFLGHADLSRWLSAADVCVVPDPPNPYNDRSTMVKLMDYMTFAKPIVAFDLPEHRVTARDAAVYVPGESDAALGDEIVALLDDPERRERLGRAGRERVEREIAWQYSVPGLLAAYRAALDGAP